MALQPWRKAIVISIKELNASTKSFLIQVSELDEFDFIPGQFVTLDLPIHEKINKRLRSYSIASSPNKKNIFELCIETNHVGEGSSYLLNVVKVGTELTFRGPAGVFSFRNPLNQDVCFIAEGTGIVPFLSMIRSMVDQEISFNNLYLIHGGKNKSDLLYHDELKKFESKIERFTYIPTLTQEVWNGEPKSVHEIYEGMISNKINIGDISTLKIYLCGWKEMVDKANKRMMELGIDKKNIYLEIYG